MQTIFENWHRFLEYDENDTDIIAKVIIFNKDGKVLVLKRGETAPKYPNYWDLPGGHVQEDEDLVQGATRETKEEVGLEVAGLSEIDKYKKVHFFLTNDYSGEIIDDMPEHSEKKWITAEDLEDLELPPGGKEALERAFQQNSDIIQEIELYQKKVKEKHCRLKSLNIKMGGNRKKEGRGIKTASCKRADSAPPGAGGV